MRRPFETDYFLGTEVSDDRIDEVIAFDTKSKERMSRWSKSGQQGLAIRERSIRVA